MGLDMFLYRVKKYPNVSGEDIKIISNHIWELEAGCKPSHEKEYNSIPIDALEFYKNEYNKTYDNSGCFEEVAYWRKANGIHRWFVDKVQDGVDDCCIHHECTPEILKELLSICKTVRNDHSLAEELLPTQSGFFFGNLGYDEWYFNNINIAIKKIEKILKETDFSVYSIYYESSW